MSPYNELRGKESFVNYKLSTMDSGLHGIVYRLEVNIFEE